MAYERKTWECGDTVTAEALNNIEGGVEQANEILPTPTASDNGKVVGVSNGEYALVEGEKSGLFVVNGTMTQPGGDAFTADKTRGEIMQAYEQGLYVYLRVSPVNGVNLVAQPSSFTTSATIVQFTRAVESSNALTIETYAIDNDGNGTVSKATATLA